MSPVQMLKSMETSICSRCECIYVGKICDECGMVYGDLQRQYCDMCCSILHTADANRHNCREKSDISANMPPATITRVAPCKSSQPCVYTGVDLVCVKCGDRVHKQCTSAHKCTIDTH